MIIINKSGFLKYKNFKFRCALGRGGIKRKIKEGDDITPKGTYRITKLYYRADRIKKIETLLKKIEIKIFHVVNTFLTNKMYISIF